MAKETILIPLRSALEDSGTGLRDMLEIWDAIMPVVARYYEGKEESYDVILYDTIFCDELHKLTKSYFEVKFSAVVPKQEDYRCKVYGWDRKKVLRGECLKAVKFETEPRGLVRLIDGLYDGYRLHHFYSGEFVLPAEVVVEHLRIRGFDLEVEVGWGGNWFETRSIKLVKETESGFVELDSYMWLVVDFGTTEWGSFLKDMKSIYLEMVVEVPEPVSETITTEEDWPF